MAIIIEDKREKQGKEGGTLIQRPFSRPVAMTTCRIPATLHVCRSEASKIKHAESARVGAATARRRRKSERREKGSIGRKPTLDKERIARFVPKKDSRTIDRDECRLRLRGGDGPRPRKVLSPPVAQEGTAAALHQVGVAFCLVWYIL